ncbi:MAG: phosphonate transport system permease protein [Afipia broomeae]|jgi:phosphonate transport system permease protein
MLTVLGVILTMVIIIDSLSSWLRRMVLSPDPASDAKLRAPVRIAKT